MAQGRVSFAPFDDGEEEGLFGVGLVDSEFEGEHFPLDLVPDVGLGGEDAVGVVHVVELEVLLDEAQQLLPALLLEQLLAFDVFPVEGRDLNGGWGTFFSLLGSSTILKTLERICALMLESCPLASSVWITRFFSQLSSSIINSNIRTPQAIIGHNPQSISHVKGPTFQSPQHNQSCVLIGWEWADGVVGYVGGCGWIVIQSENAYAEDQDDHQPGAVDHVRGGLHSAHAEGEHRAQRGHARGPVQAHLHGAADGRNEEAARLQDQRRLLHHHGPLPPRRIPLIHTNTLYPPPLILTHKCLFYQLGINLMLLFIAVGRQVI